MQKTRKEETVFVAVTFGATWLIWLGAYLLSVFSTGSFPFKDWLIPLGTAVPSVAGLILTRVYDGKKSLKALLRSSLGFKAPPAWWAYTIALFPLVLFISGLVFSRVGGRLPPSQFPLWFLPLAFFYILVLMGPLGEELGWRGFLLRRLMPRCGLARSGSVLGAIWFAWHIPLFFIPGTIQSELSKIGLPLALTGYLVYTTCISLLIAVLYARTKGNLLLCVIFHTVCNLSLGVAPMILEKSGAAILLVVLILITAFTVWLNRQSGNSVHAEG